MGLKHRLLRISKALKLFALTRRLSTPSIRILCYHGFSFTDAHRFRPKLFMAPGTFARRLDLLLESGYRVVDLDEARRQLESGDIQRDTVAITLDDGWYGVYAMAAPLLAERGLPSTLYLTSYYIEKQSPVFRIVVQYIFWKTELSSADLGDLVPGLTGTVPVRGEGADHTLWTLIQHGEQRLDNQQRDELLARLFERLQVPGDDILGKRHLSLVSIPEARNLLDSGMDLQLHTHRHYIPEDDAKLAEEIDRNRALLARITDAPRRHFCYPSGEWRPAHLPRLQKLDIATATTCDAGTNPAGSNPLALRRFLDGEDVSELEFEAELCGFQDLLRRFKARH